MNRDQFAHVLRTVARISGDNDILVIGSQSILGSYPESELPPEATGSMEVDTAFLGDADGTIADDVDVNLGEFSEFHDRFGYYPQGVSVSTGVFPDGWRERLVTFEGTEAEPGRGLCLEPHDCVLAKLVRFDEKDIKFAYALVLAGLIDLDTLDTRAVTLPVHPAVIDRIRTWITAMRDRK